MSQAYRDEEVRIQQAMNAVRIGICPNLAVAARKYKAPSRRLQERWKGVPSKLGRSGAGKKLSDAEEMALCQYLDRLDAIGVSARYQLLFKCADSILKWNHPDDTTPASTVSSEWGKRFLKRHPQYSLRKQKILDVNRKNAHHPDTIQVWFRKFQEKCIEKGIQQNDCYNMDETGFRIGIGRDQWVITKDRTRPAYLPSSSNRELVTVIECVSAGGTVIAPMVILPGILIQERWFTATGMEDNYLIATSESGYSNDELSFEWIRHFEKETVNCRKGAWRLLLLDGYGSHCTYEFVQFCDEHKIIPFCLPAHTTHLLQPLDVVLFQPFKHWHAEVVDMATRTGCTDFNKMEFLSAIASIRQQTFKPASIASSFCEIGLFPFNPEVVLRKLRELQPLRPCTPPPVTTTEEDIFNKTPLTIRTLKRQASQLLSSTSDTIPMADLQSQVRKFAKGSIIQATAGFLASEQLEHTQAAENARKVRQQQNRRTVQRGGTIYTSDARKLIRQREDEDTRKAQAAVARAEKKEIKWRLTLRKKVTKHYKEQFERWTKLHQQHINEMAEVCGQVRNTVKLKE